MEHAYWIASVAGNAAEEQAFVQEREHALGFHAGFYGCREVCRRRAPRKRRREAFSGDVADIQADRLVAELEVVEVVAAYLHHPVNSWEIVTPAARRGCGGSMTF